nr:4-coumarate--coa ligase-like 7 [Quercus suber]
MATPSSEGLAEIDGGTFSNRPSLFLHLEQGLLRNPDGPAVISMHQATDHLEDFLDNSVTSHASQGHDDSCLIWTFRQLHEASLKIASALLERGVRPGSTLVTLVPHGIEWCLWMWTASIMKFTVAPLDFGALNEGREIELQHFMTEIAPSIILAPNSVGAKAIDTAIASSNISRPFGITISDDSLDHWTPLRALARSRTADSGFDRENLLAAAREIDPDRVGFILFTSGTSMGRPKGCLVRVAATSFTMDTQRLGPQPLDTSSRCLLQTANFRAIAQVVVFLFWTAGGAIVIPGLSFDAEQALAAVEKYHVTNMVFVPAMLHAVAARPELRSRDLSSISKVSIGGDMITRDILTKAQALFPNSHIMTAHGMTEGTGIFQWPFFSSSLDDIPYFGEISPLGTVSRGVRVRIWDVENQKVANLGEPGELHVSGVAVTKGYLGGINAAMFYEENDRKWFRTGDLGMVNSDGLVYVLGRIKDVIKRAGIPITPAALESCLERYTGSQTSVVGIASPVLGQEAFAVLQSFAGVTEDDIKKHIVKSFGSDYALAGAKTLQDLGMEQFPLNATGKIMKIILAKAVEERLQSCRTRRSMSTLDPISENEGVRVKIQSMGGV